MQSFGISDIKVDISILLSYMRKCSALFIASLFILQAFYNLGVTVYWMANQNYIARELCENRDKPAMKCNGKCYLKKKLAAAQQSSPLNPANSNKTVRKDFKFSDFILDQAVFSEFYFPSKILCPFEPIQWCTRTAQAFIFHPPNRVC